MTAASGVNKTRFMNAADILFVGLERRALVDSGAESAAPHGDLRSVAGGYMTGQFIDLSYDGVA